MRIVFLPTITLIFVTVENRRCTKCLLKCFKHISDCYVAEVPENTG